MKIQNLAIEWRHYAKEGATCNRSAASGSSVKEVVAELTKELAGKGITVVFTETKYEGHSYEAIPEKLLRQAAYAARQIEKREYQC